VILLLYVDELFLTGEERLITECKRKLAAEFEMKDLRMMQLLGTRSLAEIKWDFPKSRKVCCGNLEDVRDVEL
jgi:hypothetical protein